MAKSEDGDERESQGPKGKRTGPRNEPLTPREMWKLIMGTYKVSLPYLLVFIAGLLLATWILTELVF